MRWLGVFSLLCGVFDGMHAIISLVQGVHGGITVPILFRLAFLEIFVGFLFFTEARERDKQKNP